MRTPLGERCLNGRTIMKTKGLFLDIVRSVLRYLKLYDLKAKISIKRMSPYSGIGRSHATLYHIVRYWALWTEA